MIHFLQINYTFKAIEINCKKDELNKILRSAEFLLWNEHKINQKRRIFTTINQQNLSIRDKQKLDIYDCTRIFDSFNIMKIWISAYIIEFLNH